jgi:hypothetical protein
MAQKKKKGNLHAQQKLQAAQHKKQYMERLRELCLYIGNGEPLFDLLPVHIREAIYACRSAMVRFKVKEGAKITKRFMKIMYVHVEQEMKYRKIDLMIPGNDIKSVSLFEYSQLLQPLDGILYTSPDFAWKKPFHNYLLNCDKRYDQYYQAIELIIHTACCIYCDLSKRALYSYTFNLEYPTLIPNRPPVNSKVYQVVTLDLMPLDVRYVTIRDGRRPVVQVGMVRHDNNLSTLVPLTLSPEQLHLKNADGQPEIPVYIQQHAISRTLQRTCCPYPGGVSMLIDSAIVEKREIIRDGTRYLIECYDQKLKTGYFVGMLIDGIFVILTFLLLTHSSTPEGRKLSLLTGLQREDISFLAIDDLKTLVNSDIWHNERIARIFREAGCGSILDINYRLNVDGDFAWLRDESKQDSELSRLIAEYIRLGADDEEYFENE